MDIRLTPTGVILPDGRPQFYEVDPTIDGCNATFNGIGRGFSGDDGPGGLCDDTGNSNQDLIMTNGPEGETSSLSLQMAKVFDYSDRTSLNIAMGYAYLDSKVGNPVTSFTAGSSYENSAKKVINDQNLGPSYWSNKHSFVLSARFKHYWNDDNATSVAAFFSRRSGRPLSFTYEDDTVERLFGDSDDEENILIYVPTGPGDPAMDFTTNLDDGFTQEDVDQFFELLRKRGLNKYAGKVVPKNSWDGPYFSDLDLRISQEIGLFKEHQLKVYLDIENVLNMFSDSNNIRRFNREGDVPEALRVLQLDDGVTDVYEVEDIIFERLTNNDVDDSVYRIQLGITYKF